jgi:hypothetical protein
MATDLEDPAETNCWPDLGRRSRSLATANVIQPDAPLFWPSDNSAITSTCSNYQSCAAMFDEDLLGHLARDGTTPLGDNEVEAEYLVTTDMSSSTLMLGIANSQASNWVGGRAEYTALDCGQSTCPLYLGNLHIMNATDSWDLYSEAENANVTVTNIHIQLRHPTLGVWRPSTGEIYFDQQALDLDVDFDLIIMLPPTVVLGPFDPGLLVSSIVEHSIDPDNDPDWKLWLIDGQQVAPSYVIPAGFHTIRLEVRDSRLAFDAQEQLVMIEPWEPGS